jgi:nickel-dependent lactate racemase
MKKTVGKDMVSRVSIVVHDCEKDLAQAGTVEGHPLMVNRVAFSADLVIPLTDVDNHYFAGVAGGPKSFCPGVCGREIITWEHLHMFDDYGFAKNVALGVLDGNPVYECKKRIVRAIVDSMNKHGREVYCLTAIIDPEGDLVYLEGGEIFAAHRAAAERGLQRATRALARGEVQLLVLDEICTAMAKGLVSEVRVLQVLADADARATGPVIVLTGRGATPGLLARADTVTEMRCVKHGYAAGWKAQAGVEF